MDVIPIAILVASFLCSLIFAQEFDLDAAAMLTEMSKAQLAGQSSKLTDAVSKAKIPAKAPLAPAKLVKTVIPVPSVAAAIVVTVPSVSLGSRSTVAAKSAAVAAPSNTHVVLTSPGHDASGFRRAPAKGGAAAAGTLFPSSLGGRQPLPIHDSIFTLAPLIGSNQVGAQGIPLAGGAGGGAGRAGAAGDAAAGGPGGAGAAGGTTAKPPPTTTFAGYLVGSPYPFVLPPPDIPYFGSKWNGPWGYPVGHYQAFRGTGQYITHYSYYPLSYFGSLMAPFAYGVSGRR